MGKMLIGGDWGGGRDSHAACVDVVDVTVQSRNAAPPQYKYRQGQVPAVAPAPDLQRQGPPAPRPGATGGLSWLISNEPRCIIMSTWASHVLHLPRAVLSMCVLRTFFRYVNM